MSVNAPTPTIKSFFEPLSHTISYIVADETSKECAIIDSVLDYEPQSATISYAHADALISYIRERAYTLAWILETHVHADHLTASAYIKSILGGRIAIGEGIRSVQAYFGDVFGEGDDFARDGSQFDVLWRDGETYNIGTIEAKVMYVPGHTSADVAYHIGDALFVGDTLFMPDYGSARCDFPGGSADNLYTSVKKLYALPETTRVFLCHDYLPEHRTHYAWETTIGEERHTNIHLNDSISRDAFVRMRTSRDETLGMPALIIPAIQVNMRAGIFPVDAQGRTFLKIPVNGVFSKTSPLERN